MGRKRPRPDLIKLLTEQRQALAASCESFDKGNEWEAARLATCVFTLVHDSGRIVSLLTQLGLRASARFLSTDRVKEEPGLSAASPPLLKFEMSTEFGTRFRPRFTALPDRFLWLQFPNWWEKETIFKGMGGNFITRKRLVFSLRHQDGGGHVGVLTDVAYVDLKAGGGWFGGFGNQPGKDLDMASTATMRQVAWEVTETLEKLGEVA